MIKKLIYLSAAAVLLPVTAALADVSPPPVDAMTNTWIALAFGGVALLAVIVLLSVIVRPRRSRDSDDDSTPLIDS